MFREDSDGNQEELNLDTFTWEKKQSLKVRRDNYPNESAFKEAMQHMWRTNQTIYYSSMFTKPEHDCSKEDVRKACELSIELALERANGKSVGPLIDILSKVGTYGAFTGKGNYDNAWRGSSFTISDFLPTFSRENMKGETN